MVIVVNYNQPLFTCSKSPIEILNLGVKYQDNNINTILVFLVLALNIFQTCSIVSIVDFDQVIID